MSSDMTVEAEADKSWLAPVRSLPIFMTEENKHRVGLFLAAAAIILYLPANHFHFFPPQLLPLSWFDSVVPFLPYSVWVYVSEYAYFVAVYVSCKDMVNLNKYFYSFLGLQIVSVAIFLAWPTTYPREQFPLPAQLEAVTHFVFQVLRVTDTPANCCPSLHVSSVYLSSFLFLDNQRNKFPFFFLWGTAIAISTLTTKQHYLVDVVSGFLMAVLTHGIFHRYVRYRPSSNLS